MGVPGWSFDVLGPLRVMRAGEPLDLGAPQARSALAILVLNANEVVTPGRLIDQLWGAVPPRSAKVQLQGLISQLRRTLRSSDGQPIATTDGGYLLRTGAGERDVDRFDRQVVEARTVLGQGEIALGARQLRTALSEWRGRPLDGIELAETQLAAARFDELRIATLEDVIDAELRLGEHAAAVAEIVELVEEQPLRERLRGQLMTALARCGRVAEALAAYRDWHTLLDDELGVEPSADIRAIHAGILRAEPELAPRLGSGANLPLSPRQLPRDHADFVGREALDELTDTESHGLLAATVGAERVAAEPAAADTLVRQCAGLPLALRVVSAQLVDRPHWTLADLADRLAAERGRLDWLAAGDVGVRASLTLSYERLGPLHRRLFGRLGLLPVPTFTSWVAAALAEVDLIGGERLLDQLVAAHLVEPAGRLPGGPRYRVHELVRVFAAEIGESEPEPVRRAAVCRAVGGWLRLAECAAARLPGSVPRPAPGRASRWPIDQDDADQLTGDALGWFDAEQTGLASVISAAADWGLAEHASELAAVCRVHSDHQTVVPR